jgi:hypothetical protein
MKDQLKQYQLNLRATKAKSFTYGGHPDVRPTQENTNLPETEKNLNFSQANQLKTFQAKNNLSRDQLKLRQIQEKTRPSIKQLQTKTFQSFQLNKFCLMHGKYFSPVELYKIRWSEILQYKCGTTLCRSLGIINGGRPYTDSPLGQINFRIVKKSMENI